MHPIFINNVSIPFDYNWKNIAVSVSGGADSALLAYLLCSFVPVDESKNMHVISHTRMWKTRPWQSYDSINVFNYLVNRFPNINFKRHTNFIAPELEHGNKGANLTDEYGKRVSGDNIEQRAFAEYVCHTENCDAYYNGVTRNPQGMDFNGMEERNVERTTDNSHLEIMQHMNRWALHPFRFIEKDWVVRQYQYFNIMDLFELTRSCEGEFSDLNYTNYKPGQPVPTCGECFWCKEREWAISQLHSQIIQN